jgi:hypothetical protein
VLAETLNARRTAARQRLEALQVQFARRDDTEHAPLLEFLFDAQQRAADAEFLFFRALVDHRLAITAVQANRGSLLQSMNVLLAEGPWSNSAMMAAEQQLKRFAPPIWDQFLEQPPPLSLGPAAPPFEMLDEAPIRTPIPEVISDVPNEWPPDPEPLEIRVPCSES